MSKAHALLGVDPGAHPQLSRQSSRQPSYHSGSSTYSSRRPSVAEPDDVHSLRSASSYHPRISVVEHAGRSARATAHDPRLPRRPSNSTLRSFAPPTVPTYLPHHMNSTFVPHVAYGRPYGLQLEPLERPPLKPIASATNMREVQSTADGKTGLRKALSKLSLRSTKSRSRLSEVHISEAPPSPSIAKSPRPPPSDELLALIGANAGGQGTKPKRTDQTTDETALQRSAVPLPKTTSSTSRQQHPSSRKEWFDLIDMGEDEDSNITPRADVDTREVYTDRHAVMGQDLPQPKSVETIRESTPTSQPQSSVLYEQTMFSFNDSDSDGGIQFKRTSAQSKRLFTGKKLAHSRHMSRGSSGPTMSSGYRISRSNRHRRNASSRSQDTRGTTTQHTSIDAAEASFGSYEGTSLSPLENALTESLPSLIGSGSSRPVSWFSSYPNSPMPPLRPGDLKLLAQFENSLALDDPGTQIALTRKELRKSGSSIVSDLKQGSPGNRIIAAISPEEAILLARIRRNRHDQMVPSSPTLSESTSRQSETHERHVSQVEAPALRLSLFPTQNTQEQGHARCRTVLPTTANNRQSHLASSTQKRQSVLPTNTSNRTSMLPTLTDKRRSVRPSPLQNMGKRNSVRLSSDYLRGRIRPPVPSFSASPPDTPAYGDFPSPPTSADVDPGSYIRGMSSAAARSTSHSTVRTAPATSAPVAPSPAISSPTGSSPTMTSPAMSSPPSSAPFTSSAPFRGRPLTTSRFMSEDEDDEQTDVLDAWRALGGAGG